MLHAMFFKTYKNIVKRHIRIDVDHKGLFGLPYVCMYLEG